MVESIRNIGREKAVIIVPAVSAFISFLVGTTICVTMLKSKTKLKNSYRRIIFAMTTYDVLLAFGTMLTPFRSNTNGGHGDMPTPWGCLGNHTSAVVLTAIMIFGMIASHMYNVCLSVYYLYFIKYNYRERKLKQKVEPKLHFIPLVCAIIFTIIALSTKSLNPNGTRLYWLSPFPLTCKKDQDIPCERGAIASLLNIVFGTILILCIVVNVLILLYIYVTVRRQERRSDVSRIRRVSVRLSEKVNSNKRANRTVESDSSNARVFLTQATYYALAFLICYTPAIIVNCMKVAGNSSIPFALQQLSRTIRPLQGTFNVLIFTRPRVRGLRGKYNISYFTALKMVILSGCDNVDSQNTMTRTSSRLRNANHQQSGTSPRKSWKTGLATEAILRTTSISKCEVVHSTKQESSSKSRHAIPVQNVNRMESIRIHDLNDIHHVEEECVVDAELPSHYTSSDDRLAAADNLEQSDFAKKVRFSADDTVLKNELDYIQDQFGNKV